MVYFNKSPTKINETKKSNKWSMRHELTRKKIDFTVVWN